MIGVRSSCDTLATKSLRRVSSRRVSVTSTNTASRPWCLPLTMGNGAAWTSIRRGRGPVVSISPEIGPLAARARDRIDGSSALRISSSAARPSASAGIPSVARSAGLTSSMRLSSSSTSTPSRIDSRINPSRSRSPRRAVSEAARLVAIRSIARPSSAISSRPFGRRRAVRSPPDIRRATSVIRRSEWAITCATVVDAISATTSAISSAPHMMWRTAATEAATSSIGTARRATPRLPPGSDIGMAAYIRRFWIVALKRIAVSGVPASAAATSGRSRWFSTCSRSPSATSESPITMPVPSMKVTRPCARVPSSSASASHPPRCRSGSFAASRSISARRASRSARMRSSRFASIAGRRYISPASSDRMMSPNDPANSLPRMPSLMARRCCRRRRRQPMRDRWPA